MTILRLSKYSKTPRTAEEIETAFSTPNIFEDLGRSKHHSKGVLFNTIQINKNFVNCIFSSERSIDLIKEHVEEKDRVFVMDATFKVTPNSIFQQVLIIYVKYGIKVRNLSFSILFNICFNGFSFSYFQ